MCQFKEMALAAAREAVAAGTWLDDVGTFASLDVLAACRQGQPDDTALRCCGENWDLFAVTLAQLHALSLRTCESVLQRWCVSGLDTGRLLPCGPSDSYSAMGMALYLLQFGVVGVALQSGANAAALAVRRAVVARALIASGTLHQLARALAAALQLLLLLQASKRQQQQQQPPSEPPCGPSAGLCASEQQAPPAQPQSPPPLPPPLSLGVVCAELLTASVGVLRLVVEGAAADAQALTAALAALADSQLLEHTAALALAVCDAVARGGSGGGGNISFSSSERAVAYACAEAVAEGAYTVFCLIVSGRRPTAAASTGLESDAPGSSGSVRGCSTSASGGGRSATALGAGRHRNSRHRGRQQPQLPGGTVPAAAAGQGMQPGGPPATTTSESAAAPRASCSRSLIWTLLESPHPPTLDVAGCAALAPDHFLRGPMLHTLLVMRLRLALHALEAGRHAADVAGTGTAAVEAVTATASTAAAAACGLGLLGRLGWIAGSSPLQAICLSDPLHGSTAVLGVLRVCYLAMRAVPTSTPTTSAAALSTAGGTSPLGGAQLPASRGQALSCSPAQVAALVAHTAVACAASLEKHHTFTLGGRSELYTMYTVCGGLLQVGRMPSLMRTCRCAGESPPMRASGICPPPVARPSGCGYIYISDPLAFETALVGPRPLFV